MIRHRYRTRSQTRRMTEKSDARIERLEKESQESWVQMSKMMELIRTLIRDKGQGIKPGPTKWDSPTWPKKGRACIFDRVHSPICSKCPHDTNTTYTTSRRVSVRLCTSLDAGERSGTKFKGKYSWPDNDFGSWWSKGIRENPKWVVRTIWK